MPRDTARCIVLIRKLKLRSFRAHGSSAVELGGKINAVCGPNGAGKTNLLEAVHYACLSKSFVAATDRYALRNGDPFFEITAEFTSRTGSESRVRVAFVPGEGKRVEINGSRVERISDLVGRFPVVVLSPADHNITGGAPEERRRLVNNILSQAHPIYLADLLEYRRALKQRNALLRTLQDKRGGGGELASWTEKCVDAGGKLVARRQQFVVEFANHLAEAYRAIEAVAEEPTMRYRTFVPEHARDNAEEIRLDYRQQFAQAAAREMEVRRTLVGPHRDEFVYAIDGLEVRRFASQGQHRTFALALKLAQTFYMRESTEEPPIFLLDDALDNLDSVRREAILTVLESETVGQSIITAADVHFVRPALEQKNVNRLIYVDGGRVRTGET